MRTRPPRPVGSAPGARRSARTSAHSAAYAVKPYAAGHTAHGTVFTDHTAGVCKQQSMLLCAGRHLFYIESHERNARSSCSELTDRTRLCRRIEVRALWRRRRRSAGVVGAARTGAHTRLSIYQQKTSPPRSWRLHTGCLRPHLLPPPTKSSKNLFTFAVNESPS